MISITDRSPGLSDDASPVQLSRDSKRGASLTVPWLLFQVPGSIQLIDIFSEWHKWSLVSISHLHTGTIAPRFVRR